MKYAKLFLVVILLLGSVAFASDLRCAPAPCATSNVRITPISTTYSAVEFSVAAALNNTAVVVGSNYYKSGRKCNTAFTSKAAVWSSSDPGAVAFSGGCLHPPTNDYYATDPVSAAYANGTSTTYYTGFIGNDSSAAMCGDCDVLLRSSRDGSTWSSVFGSLESLDYDSSNAQRVYIEDFDHMVVDKTGGTHDGCGYAAAMNFESNEGKREIEVAHGCPADTRTWTNVAVDTELTGGIVVFAHLALDASGTIYLTYTKCATSSCAVSTGGRTAKIYFSKSTDGGSTWSTPVNIFNITMSPTISMSGGWPGGFGNLPNTGERMTPQALLAVEQTSPTVTLMAVYETWNPVGLYLEVDSRRSTDGGRTWGSNTRVSGSQTHDQFMPCVADDGSGKVAAMWLDRRNDTNNKKYDAYVSKDTGGTWSSAVRLSAHLSDPANNGLGAPFLGDYTGCTWWVNSSGAEYFLGVWPDTSNGTNAVGMIAGYNP